MEVRIERSDDNEINLTLIPVRGTEFEVFFRKSMVVDATKPYDLSIFGPGEKVTIVTLPE